MITPEQRKKLEVEAEAFEGTGYGIYLAGAEALDRMLSTESACVTGCKNFTGGEIRHHKDCAHYPESFSKMYDELETRIQSESVSTETQSDEEAARKKYGLSDAVSLMRFEQGCRYVRSQFEPLVEEILPFVKMIRDHSGDGIGSLNAQVAKDWLARAEKLLSGAKDGKE